MVTVHRSLITKTIRLFTLSELGKALAPALTAFKETITFKAKIKVHFKKEKDTFNYCVTIITVLKVEIGKLSTIKCKEMKVEINNLNT